ncbi:hypothetical protein PybrP1_001766 [[Pythium] brassicae (nom. inval.)]|nr:hypothetical protein PybrP1_001766 [[Pythium] brassicae (nom. inval.)]
MPVIRAIHNSSEFKAVGMHRWRVLLAIYQSSRALLLPSRRRRRFGRLPRLPRCVLGLLPLGLRRPPARLPATRSLRRRRLLERSLRVRPRRCLRLRVQRPAHLVLGRRRLLGRADRCLRLLPQWRSCRLRRLRRSPAARLALGRQPRLRPRGRAHALVRFGRCCRAVLGLALAALEALAAHLHAQLAALELALVQRERLARERRAPEQHVAKALADARRAVADEPHVHDRLRLLVAREPLLEKAPHFLVRDVEAHVPEEDAAPRVHDRRLVVHAHGPVQQRRAVERERRRHARLVGERHVRVAVVLRVRQELLVRAHFHNELLVPRLVHSAARERQEPQAHGLYLAARREERLQVLRRRVQRHVAYEHCASRLGLARGRVGVNARLFRRRQRAARRQRRRFRRLLCDLLVLLLLRLLRGLLRFFCIRLVCVALFARNSSSSVLGRCALALRGGRVASRHLRRRGRADRLHVHFCARRHVSYSQ